MEELPYCREGDETHWKPPSVQEDSVAIANQPPYRNFCPSTGHEFFTDVACGN